MGTMEYHRDHATLERARCNLLLKRNSSLTLRNFGVKPNYPLGHNERAAGCGLSACIVSVGIS